MSSKLDRTYAHCLEIAHTHYENFPVASFLLPQWARRPVAAIYAFARLADDIADEGESPNTERLAQLEALSQAIKHKTPPQQHALVFIALIDTIQTHQLPEMLFHELLDAFQQDLTKTRYKNYSELLSYCQRSANPVGRLLLHLYQKATPTNLKNSDKVCTSLQLINFMQDITDDYHQRNRIYIPQDEMSQFGVTEIDIAQGLITDNMCQLKALQVKRAKMLLQSGAKLTQQLSGRFKVEIKLICAGGMLIVNKLEKHYHQPFVRPKINKTDIFRIAVQLFKL